MNITQEELTEILRLHKLWLEDNPDGVRAELVGADLSGADLRKADLRMADLWMADLTGAVFYNGWKLVKNRD